MNGKAFPGGVDGRTHRGIGGALLTLEPTNRGDRTVHMWSHVAGEERSGMSLIPREVRGLLADLARRLDVIDPPDSAAAGAPSAAEPAAADPAPLPGPPPPPAGLALVLADMRDAANAVSARAGGRIRGWVEVLGRDEQWTRRLVAAALEVAAAVADRRTLLEVAGPRLSAALRDLDVALVDGAGLHGDDVVDAEIHDYGCNGGTGRCCSVADQPPHRGAS